MGAWAEAGRTPPLGQGPSLAQPVSPRGSHVDAGTHQVVAPPSRSPVNRLVENLLIGWLIEATGQTRSQILQRLALKVDNLLPPE